MKTLYQLGYLDAVRFYDDQKSTDPEYLRGYKDGEDSIEEFGFEEVSIIQFVDE